MRTKHTMPDKFRCKFVEENGVVCDKTFSNQLVLRQHMLNMHQVSRMDGAEAAVEKRLKERSKSTQSSSIGPNGRTHSKGLLASGSPIKKKIHSSQDYKEPSKSLSRSRYQARITPSKYKPKELSELSGKAVKSRDGVQKTDAEKEIFRTLYLSEPSATAITLMERYQAATNKTIGYSTARKWKNAILNGNVF